MTRFNLPVFTSLYLKIYSRQFTAAVSSSSSRWWFVGGVCVSFTVNHQCLSKANSSGHVTWCWYIILCIMHICRVKLFDGWHLKLCILNSSLKITSLHGHIHKRVDMLMKSQYMNLNYSDPHPCTAEALLKHRVILEIMCFLYLIPSVFKDFWNVV